MSKFCRRFHFTLLLLGLLLLSIISVWAQETVELKIDWSKPEARSPAEATLQVVVNPRLERGEPPHDAAFEAVKSLGADYVRYVPWYPYPRRAVAELAPPTTEGTSWDFSLIDPMAADFFHATEGHSRIVNFSTIPEWMFVTKKPVVIPQNPNEPVWDYQQGTELRDSSLSELSQYYARLAAWFCRGGFTDELGRRRDSGHYFTLPYWEVLNEAESEHSETAKQYTERYDAIVTGIHQSVPEIKFIGMALSHPKGQAEFFEYFLNPANHKPGIPIDMISYHFYAHPTPDQSAQIQTFTFFEQAEHYLDEVQYIDAIRKRLAPNTRTAIDELGSISTGDGPRKATPAIPDSYWNLSAAFFAYMYGRLSELGIDVIGESQLLGYPTQYPSVTMVDWNTGKPNARFWALKLIHENFSRADHLVKVETGTPYVYVMGALSPDGQRKLLIVNKRDREFDLILPDARSFDIETVNQDNASEQPVMSTCTGSHIRLKALAVSAVIYRQAARP